ncbi:hypothetical protein ACW9HQ_41940, partial [Nocardia gipuzkoensis]
MVRFTGAANQAAACDRTRAAIETAGAAAGELSISRTAWAAISSAPGAAGTAGARVAIKSGSALLAAVSAATGIAEAEIRVGGSASAGSEGFLATACIP